MLSEHERAVRLALRSGDEMKTLINRLGTNEAPRGRVLSAYRQARRAIRQTSGLMGVIDVLNELRSTVEHVLRTVMASAVTAGQDQARVELAVYGLPNSYVAPYTGETELAAWLAQVDAQQSAVQATWMATGDMTQIVGDGDRVGLLTPAPVIREGSRWVGIAMLAAWSFAVEEMLTRTRRREDFMRQAVAAIDERTTDCCLQVHGQVVEFASEFHLTGTPRFSAWMRNPPFHWYCRTSTCLVRRDDANDRLSQQMRTAARNELNARQSTGTRQEIHPADARSSR